MRIVSLVPGATEIVCALGLRDSLVGVTHECDYPPGVSDLPHVTRSRIPDDAASGEIDELVRSRQDSDPALYALREDVLKHLAPDLIVTQALCEVCAVADAEVRAAACALPTAPRMVKLEPTCLEDVFNGVLAVGAAADVTSRAQDLVARLRERVAVVERAVAGGPRSTVVLLEWLDPPFCSGHWNPELVSLGGGRELLGRAGQPSHRLDWRALRETDPDVLFITCCGFDTERTAAELPLLQACPDFGTLTAVRQGQVWFADGNAYFSRPGPRLVDSLEILAAALHPDRVTRDPDLPAPRNAGDLIAACDAVPAR